MLIEESDSMKKLKPGTHSCAGLYKDKCPCAYLTVSANMAWVAPSMLWQ